MFFRKKKVEGVSPQLPDNHAPRKYLNIPSCWKSFKLPENWGKFMETLYKVIAVFSAVLVVLLWYVVLKKLG